MNAKSCSNWFKVADTNTSDASHSMMYGLVLSGQCNAAFISRCF